MFVKVKHEIMHSAKRWYDCCISTHMTNASIFVDVKPETIHFSSLLEIYISVPIIKISCTVILRRYLVLFNIVAWRINPFRGHPHTLIYPQLALFLKRIKLYWMLSDLCSNFRSVLVLNDCDWDSTATESSTSSFCSSSFWFCWDFY